MKDIYRELLRRSIEDTYAVLDTVEDENGYTVPPDVYGQMALSLYHHRVASHEREYAEARQEEQFPDGSPDQGRY